ncbi:RING-H2 finger protein ATL11 [Acorus calamus]|uniref:RING-type E3 ubiquitin transferase n=1 Tax=Acorus calamus TaxID=4465 RepID=A0AAV9C617_ACOCL|nr:RING-H2 finger protein ATL11 [Acorus calamus]
MAAASAVKFDSSMAVTVLILLSVLFFMGFFSVYVRRFTEENYSSARTGRRPPPNPRRRNYPSASRGGGADPAVVKALPLFAYEAREKAAASASAEVVAAEDCVVCLSEFEEGEVVKAIPACGHVFHVGCIDAWLSSHDSCPLCRSTQLHAPSREAAGGEDDVVVVVVGDSAADEERVSCGGVGGEGGGG